MIPQFWRGVMEFIHKTIQLNTGSSKFQNFNFSFRKSGLYCEMGNLTIGVRSSEEIN